MDHMEIGWRRLAAQYIEGKKFQAAEDVVKWMGAMQGQNYPQALWAIGQRMESGMLAAVEQSLIEGKIIRTWPMRGTLHFIAPEDSKWLLSLTASRILASSKGRLKQLELDDKILQRSAEIFRASLSGGKRLSRPAMLKLLEASGIPTHSQRGYHILWHWSQCGLLCLGPVEGTQQTFVLLEEWAPHAKELAREEALLELAKRYFNSHGPATVHDFAWWSGLTMKEARAGLELAKPFLASQKQLEAEYWFSEEASFFSLPREPAIQLLPAFDEYLLGYKDRSSVLPMEYSGKVAPGKNGVFFPIIVENGQVVGTWKRELSRNSIVLEFDLFSPEYDLPPSWNQAALAFSSFLEMPIIDGQ
ncbi:winged helix DNA-binding domain-containing protein [Planococcus shenhongbingii]|uniref:Winged helix DNA-binding domain-containing protein n=1 Tax=Planococcus shenhongbingii TaxID=3058398 RepID=A0ABT8NBZ6_9BACL|nr:winged helix DNA-binding domain-containing protein [Planococcus sp. N017]MDN7245399.1 winged helix DNA-binding domain-containing protein [Planococcus sp. N017]